MLNYIILAGKARDWAQSHLFLSSRADSAVLNRRRGISSACLSKASTPGLELYAPGIECRNSFDFTDISTAPVSQAPVEMTERPIKCLFEQGPT